MLTNFITVPARGNRRIKLTIYPGHYATSHAHVDNYISMTEVRTNASMAAETAEELAKVFKYMQVDTIICLEFTQNIGALLARELSGSRREINSGKDIHVITPSINSNNQLTFTSDTQPFVTNQNVLILLSTISTGRSLSRAQECVGYYGGRLDLIMMRICDIINAFPNVVICTIFILVFGSGMRAMILALIVRGWIPTARMIRSQFLRFRGREYVMAAQTMGVPNRALIFRHILPNSIGPIITRTMIAIPDAIFMESFMAYIGLGLAPPEPSIGTLLSRGQRVLMQYPHLTLFPALTISVLMIAFNLFGNGLRDALDPTQRGLD